MKKLRLTSNGEMCPWKLGLCLFTLEQLYYQNGNIETGMLKFEVFVSKQSQSALQNFYYKFTGGEEGSTKFHQELVLTLTWSAPASMLETWQEIMRILRLSEFQKYALLVTGDNVK